MYIYIYIYVYIPYFCPLTACRQGPLRLLGLPLLPVREPQLLLLYVIVPSIKGTKDKCLHLIGL